MEINVNITVDSDTEGIKIDNSLSNVLYPGVSSHDRADSVRDLIRWVLAIAHSSKTGQDLGDSAAYVNGHTSDTH